jgi:GTP cyclohydrolase I
MGSSLKKRHIKWNEIYERVNKIKEKHPDSKFWGIPRGGQVVAGLTMGAVDSIEDCDVIVDDIFDSGKTAEKYLKYDKPIEFVYDKRVEPDLPWLVFPWENEFDRGFENDIIRLLQRIGENPKRDGLVDTPKRVAKAWIELTTKPEFNPTVFNANGYDQMIIEKDIKYYTFCEHHLLPFFGKAHIGYIPDGKIIGLSKLSRCVEYFSKGLNTQEYLTQNIANYLEEKLNANGVAVLLSGRHLCKEMRGVKKQGEMITSVVHGFFKDDQKARDEFLSLVK